MPALSRVSSRTSESSVESSGSSSTASSSGVYVPLHKRSGSASSQTSASSVGSTQSAKREYFNPTGRYTIHELLNLSCSPLSKIVSEERKAELRTNASEILVKRFDEHLNRRERKYQEFTTRKHLGELIKEARQEQKDKRPAGQKQKDAAHGQRQQQQHQHQRQKSRSQTSSPQPQPQSKPQPQSQPQPQPRGFGQRTSPQPSQYRPYFQAISPFDTTLSHSSSLQSIVAH